MPRRAPAKIAVGAPVAGSKPSIRDVALLSGVALGTVSRVINGHPNVSAERRQRVKDAIVALGYVPDMVAQSMRNRRSMTFACVMRDFTVPVLSMFVDAMQKEIDAFGFSLMYASSYHDPAREIALLKGFQQRRIDGLVIATSSETDVDLLSALEAVKFPVVLIDRDAPAALDAVRIDHAHAVGEAVEYLHDLGHERIAFISGEPGLHATRSRLQGYEKAMAGRGLRIDRALVRTISFSGDVGYHEGIRLLRGASPPTAIIAGGTSMLPGVIQATRELGLSVPRDVSIVAGADSDLARLLSPSITTIRWGHDVLGRAAAQFLMNRLSRPALVRQQMVVNAEFVVRESCCAPPREPKTKPHARRVARGA